MNLSSKLLYLFINQSQLRIRLILILQKLLTCTLFYSRLMVLSHRVISLFGIIGFRLSLESEVLKIVMIEGVIMGFVYWRLFSIIITFFSHIVSLWWRVVLFQLIVNFFIVKLRVKFMRMLFLLLMRGIFFWLVNWYYRCTLLWQTLFFKRKHTPHLLAQPVFLSQWLNCMHLIRRI